MKRTLTIAAIAALAGSTAAQFTHVRAPRSSERSHAELLGSALGETFDRPHRSPDLFGDSFTAERVSDYSDKTWDAGTYGIEIIGHEAGHKHTLGVINDGNFEGLLRTENVGATATVSIDDSFAWALKSDESDGGALWSSDSHRNADCRDHMVTYALYQDDRFFGFAIFFEDLPKWHWDKDYNDAAALLTLVPTPQAAGLAFAGLGGLGVAAGRRRR